MKIKYIIFILTAFILNACEDYLEPESLSTFDLSYVFSNTEDARKGVNAIYVHFSHDGFRSRLSNNMTGCTDIEHAGDRSASGDRYQLWRLDAQVSNRDLQYVWDIAYQAIRDANIAIEGITNSSVYSDGDQADIDEMNNLLGESYTLRAYWYSMLCFYFGDVPFMIEAPKAGVEFNLPRKNRNEILSAIIQDLIDVEEKMKWADQTTFGIEQGNREYTLGMIARLSLQRGGYYLVTDTTGSGNDNMEMVRDDDYLEYYEIARKYCKKLIDLKDRPLNPDFGEIFLNECHFVVPVNDEILFEVPFAKGEGDVGWNIGIRVEKSTIPGLNPYGSGSNYMGMPPTYLYSFDSLDKRLPVTCGLYMINKDYVKELVDAGNMSISQAKWSRHYMKEGDEPGPDTDKGTGINWPMMRYSDVILMYAESENELNGPTTEAQNALKRIRQRAFNETDWPEKVDQYVTNVSGSKKDFFDAIVNERAWEFGGEMIRRYELIRWNLYYTKIKEMMDGLIKMADDAFNETGTLPDYLYVRTIPNENSGDFQVLNLFSKVGTAPDETWERKSWLRSLTNSVGTGYANWMNTQYINYLDPPWIDAQKDPSEPIVRYLFPIPLTGIIASDGVLNNKGYGFGLD